MSLQDERDAFDSGGVGAVAAFREALFDELFRISEQRDALASFAFPAEVILEAFAIGGLRKHARQRELAEAARTAEEQGVGNAFAPQPAAQGGDDAFIAEEFGEAHGLAAFLGESSHQNLEDRGENFGSDLLLRAHGAAHFVEARNGGPIGAAGELIVHGGGLFEMAKAGLLNILFNRGVGTGGFAGDKFLGLARRNSKVENQRFAREIVNAVFELLDPSDECQAISGRHTRRLMGEV